MHPLFRKFLLLFALVAGTASAAPAPFDQARFDALQKAGKPTLIMVHADWCPTCRAQAPILSELLGSSEFSHVNALRVDFDDQKDVARRFGVQYQSTLIVFKDGKEVGRSTGDTHKDSIAALLRKAL